MCFGFLPSSFQDTAWKAERKYLNTAEIVERAVEIQCTLVPHGFGIESNQFQSLLAEQIHAEAKRRGVALRLSTMENYENKLVRIRTLTPYLAKGVFRFKVD